MSRPNVTRMERDEADPRRALDDDEQRARLASAAALKAGHRARRTNAGSADDQARQAVDARLAERTARRKRGS